MNAPSPTKLFFRRLWVVLSCFVGPCGLYYLDVATDINLAHVYYWEYIAYNLSNPITSTYWTRHNTNFMLTTLYISLSMFMTCLWNFYTHLTEADIFPVFEKMPRSLRLIFYMVIFFSPFAPMMTYLENTYIQMKQLNVTTQPMHEVRGILVL